MNTAKERLDQVLEYTNQSFNSLAKRIGLKRSQNLYDIRDGKVKNISFELASLINKAFDEINKDWLVTGDGEMLKTTNPPAARNQDYAPYLENISASAGLNFLMNNGDATSYIKIPGVGVDAYINVFGDSMYPKYCAGEIIGVKEVLKEDLFFGHAFVIQMSDGEAYIKYILPGKDEDHWSLESENPKYPPRQFHLSKISKIFKIKTTVTKNSL